MSDFDTIFTFDALFDDFFYAPIQAARASTTFYVLVTMFSDYFTSFRIILHRFLPF